MEKKKTCRIPHRANDSSCQRVQQVKKMYLNKKWSTLKVTQLNLQKGWEVLAKLTNTGNHLNVHEVLQVQCCQRTFSQTMGAQLDGNQGEEKHLNREWTWRRNKTEQVAEDCSFSFLFAFWEFTFITGLHVHNNWKLAFQEIFCLSAAFRRGWWTRELAAETEVNRWFF